MYAAVDIGGTKTLIAVFDAHGKLLEKIKFATPEDYPEFISSLAENLAKLSHKDFKAAVVAAPGRIDRDRGIGLRFGNLPWREVPLQEDAAKVLGCKVRLENDVKLATLSEARLLEGEYDKVLYMTISTGIGIGLAVHGKLDPESIDAEVGGMLLENEGQLKRWEDFASGRAIVEKFGKRASEITDLADWYIIARNLAIGMTNVISSFTPDVIVLGGGVGTHLDNFRDRLVEELKIYENPLAPTPPIIKAQRPEEAVIYGCYELAKDING